MTGFVLQVHIYAFFLSKSQQRPSMRNIYCQTYPTIIQSQQMGVYFRVYNPPHLFKQSVLTRGLNTAQKIAYYF